MKVAYLVNQYPKVSHTFVRREIAALEAAGLDVERYSVQPTRDIVDHRDRLEAERTDVLLSGGAGSLLTALARQALQSPVRLARATRLALELGWRSDRGLTRHLAYLAEACVLREGLRRKDVGHVHAHFGTNSTTVALLCHALGGPEFSFTVHGPEEFDKAPLIGLGRKVAGARFVAAISSFGRSQLFRVSQPGDWQKIHVVRCGLDADLLEAEPTPIPAERRLVCVGRLSEQKGQLVLLDAAARLKQQGLQFELTLAGDGELRPLIESRCRELGLEGVVRITGWLDQDAVVRELRAARALVLPSFAEGLPVVIMEAFALGRPVISTFVAGIPELVQPGENGWLVPAGSVDALAQAMTECLAATPERLSALGRHGRRRVLEQHDVRLSGSELKRLFEAV